MDSFKEIAEAYIGMRFEEEKLNHIWEGKEIFVKNPSELIRLINRDNVLKRHIGKRAVYFDDNELVVGDGTAAIGPMGDDGSVQWDDLVKNIMQNIKSWDDIQKEKKPSADQTVIGKFNVLLPKEIAGTYGSPNVKLKNPRAIVDADDTEAERIKKVIHSAKDKIKVRVMKRATGNKVYIDAEDEKGFNIALEKLKSL